MPVFVFVRAVGVAAVRLLCQGKTRRGALIRGYVSPEASFLGDLLHLTVGWLANGAGGA